MNRTRLAAALLLATAAPTLGQSQELYALARFEKIFRIDGYQSASTVQLVEIGTFDRDVAPTPPVGFPTGLVHDPVGNDLVLLVSDTGGGGPAAFYRFDLATGVTSCAGEVGAQRVRGLARRADGWLVTVVDGAELLWIDPAGGAPIRTPLQQSLSFDGDFADVVFDARGVPVVSGVDGTTYRVDPITGAMVAVGPPPLNNLRTGVEVDLDGSYYFCTGTAILNRYEPASATLTQLLGSFNTATNFYALAFTEHAQGDGVDVVCTAQPHAGGESAAVEVIGTSVAADNDVQIIVRRLPPTFGLFFTGRSATAVPLSFGTLCIAGPLQRYTTPVATGNAGLASLEVDLNALPDGSAVLAGEEHLFQFWFRDFSGGAGGSNLSPAVRVTFQ